MNRRLFLVGLIAVVPLGMGWWAKSAASWRPVGMGDVAGQNDGREQLVTSENYVLSTRFGDVRTLCTVFDRRNNQAQPVRFSETRVTGLAGDSFWGFYWDEAKHVGNVDIEAGKGFSFDLEEFSPRQGNIPTVRVLPAENRIVLLCANHICSWNFRTAQLESDTHIGDENGQVLSRDARTFVAFDLNGFSIGDAHTGKIRKKIPFRGFNFFESLYFSPYGRYALCEQPTAPTQMRVVEVASGKSLWSFDNPNNSVSDWTVCDDEQTIFVLKGKFWEVRNLRTGNLLRRLPRVPGSSRVASSPDGATLYSVADGVLFRQRAR